MLLSSQLFSLQYAIWPGMFSLLPFSRYLQTVVQAKRHRSLSSSYSIKQPPFLRSINPLRNMSLRSMILQNMILRNMILQNMILRNMILQNMILRNMILRSMRLRSMWTESTHTSPTNMPSRMVRRVGAVPTSEMALVAVLTDTSTTLVQLPSFQTIRNGSLSRICSTTTNPGYIISAALTSGALTIR